MTRNVGNAREKNGTQPGEVFIDSFTHAIYCPHQLAPPSSAPPVNNPGGTLNYLQVHGAGSSAFFGVPYSQIRMLASVLLSYFDLHKVLVTNYQAMEENEVDSANGELDKAAVEAVANPDVG